MPGPPSGSTGSGHRDRIRLAAMMGLFFLVVCAVGILRPIKNALALDGLGSTDFYKVYLVSAVVVLFVPAYNRLADRFEARRLIAAVALFFALNLLLLRAVYVDGSTIFGLVFYGWYDLFAAALVTQFFMLTQLFFNARTAKAAYPIVIAGGSIGATLGGAVTGFFAQRVGTPNLLLVAAALILVFSLGIPVVLSAHDTARPRRSAEKFSSGEVRRLFRNRHVRLIAAMVLITVLAKQLVDYQFNTLTKEVFEDLDAMSAFQGKFNAATQWLPLVALATLQPLLRRYGMVAAVMMLPATMLFANLGLVLFWGLGAAVVAKGAETSLRYSAERAGREILYVPVAEDIKMRAKAYIDVAVEKGIGKALSGLLIPVLLLFMDYRSTAWVGLALSAAWFIFALGSRREYVRTLRQSIEGRFASLRGSFATILDATTLPALRRALGSGDAAQAAFALELAGQAPAGETRALAPELRELATHPEPGIRERAVTQLGRLGPGEADEAALRGALSDPEPAVRDAAVRALLGQPGEARARVLAGLLTSDAPGVRIAGLTWLAGGDATEADRAAARGAYRPNRADDTDARIEQALAAVAIREAGAAARLAPLLVDGDARVAAAAIRAAGLLGDAELRPAIIAALRRPATREAARDALAAQGTAVLGELAGRLMDPAEDAAVRRSIPSVLSRIPSPHTVELLLDAALATETDQVLDYRIIKALCKLRAQHPELTFPADRTERLVAREIETGRRYAAAWDAAGRDGDSPRVALLRAALGESWNERRETTFRALGLQHPPDGMHRCYVALRDGDARSRANALEWLESTIGRTAFLRVEGVTGSESATGRGGERRGLDALLEPLTADEDAWIASCAAAALAERAGNGALDPDTRDDMELIERVFLLQKVDLLRGARTAHLAMLASIAEEVDVGEGEVLVREGEPADALYVVVSGGVRLHGVGGTLVLGDGAAFGTWALIDDAPSVVEAQATEPGRVLRITRDAFHDLIADHPELAIGLLQGLAQRVRTLIA